MSQENPEQEPTLAEIEQSVAARDDEQPTDRDYQPHEITWTASEYVAHAKGTSWYAGLAAVAVVLALIIWLLTKDVVSASVVVFGALALGVVGSREPQPREYTVNDSGLTIGEKFHQYEEFRCFSILPEGAFSSIVLMPLKRFGAPTTIYYAPEDEDAIVDCLSAYLPIEEGHHDPIDRLMHKIRF